MSAHLGRIDCATYASQSDEATKDLPDKVTSERSVSG